jgi:uncharacterized protein YkwD
VDARQPASVAAHSSRREEANGERNRQRARQRYHPGMVPADLRRRTERRFFCAMSRMLLCVVTCLSAGAASADTLTVDLAGVEGCGEQPAVELKGTLDEVAMELAHGVQLNDAIKHAGYPVVRSLQMHVIGPTDDTSIRELIKNRYCGNLKEPFTDVGIFRKEEETWIVLAVRIEQPAAGDATAVSARVLELVNAAREEPRQCGRKRFAAARPLTLSGKLTEAASRQARDMASQHTLDHRGSDGSQPGERLSSTGYRWQAMGENIAAGQPNADAVVAAWLESPEHCTNLMEPRFTEMGVAFELTPSEQPAIYWAQVLAAPE